VRILLIYVVMALTLPIFGQEAQTILMMSHNGVVTSARWNTDESQILTTGEDGTAKVWDADTGEELLVMNHAGSVRGGCWGVDETEIITWTGDGGVYVWNAMSGERIAQMPEGHTDTIFEVLWDASGDLVVSLSRDSTAKVWRRSDDSVITLEHRSPVVMGGFLNNEAQFYTYEENGNLHIWNVGEYEGAETDLLIGQDVLGLRWNNDETRLLTWSADRTAQLWNFETRRVIHTFNHRSFVDGATLTEDESVVITWSADDTARIWDTETGAELAVFVHNDWVNGATLNADEMLLASWSHTQVWVWSIEGDLITKLDHDNLVNGAAWNDDGSQILSWGWDGAARLWRFTS